MCYQEKIKRISLSTLYEKFRVMIYQNRYTLGDDQLGRTSVEKDLGVLVGQQVGHELAV